MSVDDSDAEPRAVTSFARRGGATVTELSCKYAKKNPYIGNPRLKTPYVPNNGVEAGRIFQRASTPGVERLRSECEQLLNVGLESFEALRACQAQALHLFAVLEE